jgi:hypothetical protein
MSSTFVLFLTLPPQIPILALGIMYFSDTEITQFGISKIIKPHSYYLVNNFNWTNIKLIVLRIHESLLIISNLISVEKILYSELEMCMLAKYHICTWQVLFLWKQYNSEYIKFNLEKEASRKITVYHEYNKP